MTVPTTVMEFAEMRLKAIWDLQEAGLITLREAQEKMQLLLTFLPIMLFLELAPFPDIAENQIKEADDDDKAIRP